MDTNSAILTVVIPVTRIAGKIDFLKFNLSIAKRCNFKVILIHDIQDSNSSKILNELVQGSKHWTLIEGEYGNAARARNEGLKIVDTEWICFWDSDDKVKGNNFVDLLIKTIKENSDIGIGNFDMNYLEKVSRISKTKLLSLQRNIVTHPGIWRYNFRRDFIKNQKFRNLSLGEDVVYICEAFSKNPKITSVSNSIYSYSVNFPGQITSVFKNYAENLQILSALKELLIVENTKNKDLILRIFLRQCLSLLKRAGLKTKIQTVIQFFGVLNLLVKPREGDFNGNFLRSSTVRTSFSKAEKLNTVYLHGGLGNQLFQITELLERFSPANFQITSTSVNIFDKYNLLCPIDSIVTTNTSLSTKLSKLRFKKSINILLRFNYWIQSNNHLFSSVGRFLERVYIPLLEFSFFRGYSVMTDNCVTSKSFHKKRKPFLFIGYFQFSKNHISKTSLDYLKDLLDPRHFESSDYNSTLSEIDLPLVIHVRLGDYKKVRNLQSIDNDYFLKAVDFVAQKENFNSVWVFSNEPSSAMNYLPKVVMQHSKLFRSGHINEFYEFQAMRLGASYIISNSTFSWWASILSFTPNPTVVAPKIWFKSQNQPYALFPSNWILI